MAYILIYLKWTFTSLGSFTFYYDEHAAMFKLIEALWRINASMNQVIIDPGTGLPSVWHQYTAWTKNAYLSSAPLEINFSEIWTDVKKQRKKMYMKTSFANWLPFYRDFNVLT